MSLARAGFWRIVQSMCRYWRVWHKAKIKQDRDLEIVPEGGIQVHGV